MRSLLIVKYLRAPEHPGKLRVVRGLARTVIPETGVIAPVGHGLRLRLHPRDWIEYLLLRGTEYEPRTLQFIAANVTAGDGAVLAGINFGLHVAVAAQAVGPGGLVLGVEPQPDALTRTRQNLQLNGLDTRVHLAAAALGSDVRLATMAWSNPENAGAASLFDSGDCFSVPVIPLQQLLCRLGDRPFRLLLLDIQGYELQALRGVDLRQHGPELTIVELDPEFLLRANLTAEEVVAPLRAAGYQLFDLFGREASSVLLSLPERNLVAVRQPAKVRWCSGSKD